MRVGLKALDEAPDKPVQNGLLESCNGSFPDECSVSPVSSLSEARERNSAWKEGDNTHRPHSLGNLTPNDFVQQLSMESRGD